MSEQIQPTPRRISCHRQNTEAMMDVQNRHETHAQTRHGWECCSYCGSILAEDFMQLLELGAPLGPTDKNYKVYVDVPNADAGKPCLTSIANFNPKDGRAIEVTKEIAAQFPSSQLRPGVDFVTIGTERATTRLKFYFQHFSEEHARAFVALYNDKKLKLGDPGYFYVMPYFMKPL